MPRSQLLKVAAVVSVLAVLAVAHGTGVLARFGDPAGVARTLVALGPWGYLAFVAAYAVFQPFGVPGTIFIMAAPLIWPWPVAFALSMTGTMAASVVGFSFARLVARDWLAGLIPERFRKYDEALATRAFGTVFWLRFIFWMPPLLHAFFGVSKVRFSTHCAASFLGYLLPIFLVSYFGQKIFDLVKEVPVVGWLGFVAALAVLGLTVFGVRRCARSAHQ
ncbi:MAG: VTT domain-containing protein [Polyangiaceae bacterium]